MSSVQAFFFRQMAKVMMAVMMRRSTIEEWRAMSAGRSETPKAPEGVSMQPVEMGGVPCEWLIPQGVGECVLLYFHGGGWVFGWYNPHRGMVSRLAQVCGTQALAVDYRLAPENPFPAALDDCLSAYRALLATGVPAEKVVFAGDSAGGNLVLTTLLALKQSGEPLPAAGVCLSPATNLAEQGKSYQENAAKDAILNERFAQVVGPAYVNGTDPHNPLLSPVFGDLSGLPPLLIQAGCDEILLDDARSFAENAKQAGVDVTLQTYEGMWHVWQIFAPYLPEANQAIEAIGAFVKQHCESKG